MKRIKKNSVILSFILIAFAVLYLYCQNTVLQVSHYEVNSSKIISDSDEYKIVQISDFHNAKNKWLRKQIKTQIEKEKADIIVITGDFIDSRKTDVEASLKFISELSSNLESSSIYYVPGNHESRIKDSYEELKKGLAAENVNILEDEYAELQHNGNVINLIGIKDPSFYEESLYIGEEQVTENSINDALKGLKNKDACRILLAHRPEMFEQYKECNMDLIFSGHAHGGQIRIPFIGGVIAPNQGWMPEYTEGVYHLNESTMVVCRGIGNSLFPFRINNRPELVVVNLRPS